MNKSKDPLKIIIITIGLSPIVKPLIDSRFKTVGIIESGIRKKARMTIKEIVFLLFRIINRKVKGLNKLCNKYKIPYYYMDSGCDRNLEKWVKNLSPDLIIIYGMTELLKKSIYEIPKYSSINLHPSLLPAYRGHSPEFWSYYNTELNPGVTLHFVDEGEDTGDIIYQKRYSLPLGSRFPEMERKSIGEIGAQMILKACDEFEKGDIPRIKQPLESTTIRARKILKDEHSDLIHWETWSVERTWHLLRGPESWLNALEQPKGIYRWKIMNYEVCPMSDYTASKIYKEKGKHFVACENGKIFLTKYISIKDFLLTILTN
ncbi:methionyl-tRNA formyltransferase [Peribacillus sp. NPDC097198]|uniref:methionyl-tRNA formyltransferase n=1 Tax=Peribacillus sp. NPDC097198 TaxID=3364397 RepID=UPI0037F93FE7